MPAATLSSPMLIDVLWPPGLAGRSMTRRALLVLAGTLLLALSARAQIPFWPVPMTMQTFVVLVIAMSYGSRLGMLTVAAYLLEGAAGLPVFAGGGGLAYFAGPTAGYLAGFVVAAGLVGALGERGWDRCVGTTVLAMALGTLIIFAGGVTGLALYLGAAGLGGVGAAVASGLVPFVPAALFKIALAAATLPGTWRLVGRR